jgi:CBS domain-containing protein
MRVLDPVSFALRKKGNDIWSVPSDATVYSAMQMMADKDVGALLVIDHGQLVGVVSERDYARKVILLGRGSKETPVSEIMVASPITIRPESAQSVPLTKPCDLSQRTGFAIFLWFATARFLE